jgi:hypothetical protein
MLITPGRGLLPRRIPRKRTEKRLRAAEIRDAALQILKLYGQHRTTKARSGEDIRDVHCNIGEFTILYRTPFQPLPICDELARRGWLSAENQRKWNQDYGLDIWKGKKVFRAAWNDPAEINIGNFQRGDWEAEFLLLVSQA